MRRLDVYVNDTKAGLVEECIPGKDYRFTYTPEYIAGVQPPISLTLPKRREPYVSENLFPFFTNLLPEGANRKVICRELKIDERDFFGMLMATVGTDIIGAVNFKNVSDAD
ncbi:MAG: HipA N-terminal domain-containing protein [Bacteroidales bacterium]|nr:HipA N-terminal domain-containing protein [Bacteroidales bacterium]